MRNYRWTDSFAEIQGASKRVREVEIGRERESAHARARERNRERDRDTGRVCGDVGLPRGDVGLF